MTEDPGGFMAKAINLLSAELTTEEIAQAEARAGVPPSPRDLLNIIAEMVETKRGAAADPQARSRCTWCGRVDGHAAACLGSSHPVVKDGTSTSISSEAPELAGAEIW